jgi:hypothetical protein
VIAIVMTESEMMFAEAAALVHEVVEAARGSAIVRVHPKQLRPSFTGRMIDKIRLDDLKAKMGGGRGWRRREPVMAVRIPLRNKKAVRAGTRQALQLYGVWGGCHRAVAAQELGLIDAYIRVLEPEAHGVDFAFMKKHEKLIVREIQASEPAPEPFGLMAQVRLLRDVLSDYAALNVADRHARPTLDLVRNLFSPALKE